MSQARSVGFPEKSEANEVSSPKFIQHDLEIDCITNGAGNVDLSPIIKINLFKSANSGRPNSLYGYDEGSQEFYYNSFCTQDVEVGSIGFYIANNVILHGSGFIVKDGKILDGKDLIPLYVKDQITAGTRWDFAYDVLCTEHVDEQCLILCSDAHKIYGHWLIDILPRLWLYQKFCQGSEANMRVVLPSDTPDFALHILSCYFGINTRDLRLFSFPEHNVRLRSAIVPSLLHNSHYFHPAINLFVDDMVNMAFQRVKEKAVPSERPSRLYVSRRRFRDKSTSYARALANEGEIIDLLKSFNFSIVYPETMSWVEQIAIFSRARIVAGEAGSGLHNAIFAPRGSTTICMNPQNHVQGSIAAARDQNIFYACATKSHNDPSKFTISCSKLKELIEYGILLEDKIQQKQHVVGRS